MPRSSPRAARRPVHDREALWNAVEAREAREDAQLCREAIITLPRELTPKQRLELVRGFVTREFVAKGMIADLAIHNQRGRAAPQPDPSR